MSFDPMVRSVSEEMSKGVVWLQPDNSVLDALVLMERERVTALPVVDEAERCVGIVSATDLVKVARQAAELLVQIADCDDGHQREAMVNRLTENGFAKGKVSELMRTPVKSVAPDISIVKASKKMLRRRIHHLPVTNERNELLGIVSTMDLLAALVKAATEKGEQLSSTT